MCAEESERMEQGFNKIDAEQEIKFEQNVEEKFCDMLCERIVANIERRNEHQAILDQLDESDNLRRSSRNSFQ